MNRISSVIAAMLWCGSLLCAVVAASVRYYEPSLASRSLSIGGPTMGTAYAVKVAEAPQGMDASILKAEVDVVLSRISLAMSTYDPQSELSQFNHSNSTDWCAVSDGTARVVAESLRVAELTDGALDVTVGPLVNLWHFGAEEAASEARPSDDQIDAASARVGYQNLQVRDDPPSLRKIRSDVYVDLAAVAKGFSVDKIAARLESLGVSNYMVEVGGETRTRGHNEHGQPWRIAIESPLDGVRAVQRTVQPGSLGMATSGDYRNYFEADGVRYTHIIDPRTARPIVHRLASVTVLDPSCATADALATGLMVIGPDAGYEFAVKHDLPVLLIVKTSAGFEERATPRFRQLAKTAR